MATIALPDALEIGRRVLALRTELRLDQEDLADKAGLSRPYISRLERGAVPNPKLYDLARVADVLDVSISALIAAASEERTVRAQELLDATTGLPPETVDALFEAWRASLAIIDVGRRQRAN